MSNLDWALSVAAALAALGTLFAAVAFGGAPPPAKDADTYHGRHRKADAEALDTLITDTLAGLYVKPATASRVRGAQRESELLVAA